MGQIACANVLSDIYTLGITDIDSVQMILGIPTDMASNERDVVTRLVGQGFKERCKTAGCAITGGDTKQNAWFMIGGVATAVLPTSNIIRPLSAQAGDSIILTKPLGTTAATTLYRWLEQPDKLELIKDCITKSEIEIAYHHALHSMLTLNRAASSLMQKFGVHAATDITGYGVIGHAENLLRHQRNNVDFIIERLPIIEYMHKADIHLNNRFKLLEGKGIETSGGLLLCIPSENANSYIEALRALDNGDGWLIGKVVEGNGRVVIREPDQLHVINVSSPLI
ncbi:hypothetical protein O3M35_012563 [Rhynocoris fuscipes]|uniref:Selenide, water dikinase n=1 Tax=Rhynocoris fuscipes TaxID=488301 RepID=A0AAW1CTY5_9HEMI